MTLFSTEYGGAETGGSRSEPHLLSEREPLLQHHPSPGPRRPQIPGAQAGEHDPPGHQGHLAGPATVRRGRDFCKCPTFPLLAMWTAGVIPLHFYIFHEF